jgi:hypothetical protein
MSEPTNTPGPVTLADIFGAKGTIIGAVESLKSGLSWWRQRRWSYAGIDAVVDTELDRVFGRSMGEILEGVFRSETDDGVQATFGQITKLLKKVKKTRKELHRYQKATPQEPAEFQLGTKQKVTWKLNHIIRFDATGGNPVEIELDVEIALVFGGASVGVAQRDLHYLSLGTCHLGGSTLKYAVRFGGSDFAGPPITLPDRKKNLGRIPFTPPITIPFMDRRTGLRRIGGERRVEVVEVEVERRASTRRVAERRGGPDRRKGNRRGSDRREGVERRISKDRRTAKA